MKKLLLTLLLLPLSSTVSLAQGVGAPPGIYMSTTEIMAKLDEAAASSASAGGWSVTISPGVSVRRRSSSVDQYAVMHPYSVEIYRILEGSGTLVTGGLLNLPLAASTDSNIIRTEQGVTGGLARKVNAGDVLVLQPGTPHYFSQIDGESITYMESRIMISTHAIQYQ